MVLTSDSTVSATKSVDDIRPAESANETRGRIAASSKCVFASDAYDLTFQAMGTRCRVSFASAPKQAPALQNAVIDWVAAFESKYSRFLPGSLISQINAAAGVKAVAIDAETERLFALCDQMHFMTRGVFDPSALPLLRLWNWKRGEVPSDAGIATAMRLVGWRKVQRKPGEIFFANAGHGARYRRHG
jgi:FAD:protein FMN transferase